MPQESDTFFTYYCCHNLSNCLHDVKLVVVSDGILFYVFMTFKVLLQSEIFFMIKSLGRSLQNLAGMGFFFFLFQSHSTSTQFPCWRCNWSLS